VHLEVNLLYSYPQHYVNVGGQFQALAALIPVISWEIIPESSKRKQGQQRHFSSTRDGKEAILLPQMEFQVSGP
jgi:hypothetical protein